MPYDRKVVGVLLALKILAHVGGDLPVLGSHLEQRNNSHQALPVNMLRMQVKAIPA